MAEIDLEDLESALELEDRDLFEWVEGVCDIPVPDELRTHSLALLLRRSIVVRLDTFQQLVQPWPSRYDRLVDTLTPQLRAFLGNSKAVADYICALNSAPITLDGVRVAQLYFWDVDGEWMGLEQPPSWLKQAWPDYARYGSNGWIYSASNQQMQLSSEYSGLRDTYLLVSFVSRDYERCICATLDTRGGLSVYDPQQCRLSSLIPPLRQILQAVVGPTDGHVDVVYGECMALTRKTSSRLWCWYLLYLLALNPGTFPVTLLRRLDQRAVYRYLFVFLYWLVTEERLETEQLVGRGEETRITRSCNSNTAPAMYRVDRILPWRFLADIWN